MGGGSSCRFYRVLVADSSPACICLSVLLFARMGGRMGGWGTRYPGSGMGHAVVAGGGGDRGQGGGHGTRLLGGRSCVRWKDGGQPAWSPIRQALSRYAVAGSPALPATHMWSLSPQIRQAPYLLSDFGFFAGRSGSCAPSSWMQNG